MSYCIKDLYDYQSVKNCCTCAIVKMKTDFYFRMDRIIISIEVIVCNVRVSNKKNGIVTIMIELKKKTIGEN